MIHAAIIRSGASADTADLVIAAARCWRSARDKGRSASPPLHTLLSDRQCPMLAAAFDSLLLLYEQAFDRPFAVGGTAGVSEDEQRLANLLRTASRTPPCLAAGKGAATALDCALCSTRILLMIAGQDTPGRDPVKALS